MFTLVLLDTALTVTKEATETVITSTREPHIVVDTRAVHARVTQTLVELTARIAITVSVVVTAAAASALSVVTVVITQRIVVALVKVTFVTFTLDLVKVNGFIVQTRATVFYVYAVTKIQHILNIKIRQLFQLIWMMFLTGNVRYDRLIRLYTLYQNC